MDDVSMRQRLAGILASGNWHLDDAWSILHQPDVDRRWNAFPGTNHDAMC
jgi:hypothetical protein